jgi:hypothetical protein
MTTKTLPDSTTAAYYYGGSGVTLVNTGTQGRPGASGINFGFVVSGNNDTLINNGTVFAQRVGVYITGSGDSVINAAGKNITATEPPQGGINFYNFSGTVTNYGTISGYAAATLGDGGNAVEMRHGGLVTNFGTLLNGGALFRTNPGTLINSGVILGNAAYGGVYMQAGGTVTNLAGGVISANGATESYQGAPPYGIFIAGGAATITNAGTINGASGNAVLLPTGFQNRVIVDPGAVFVGTVNGGTAVDATLELASSASTGTLSGFGTQFTNFGTVAFDPSARWLVDASTAINSSVITGFGVSDTIDMAGFVAVSDTFASNTLVLTNASNAHVTLHVQGTFTTSNFSVAADGGGGTDLVFNATTQAALAYGQTIDEAGIVATSETVTTGVMTLFNGASPVGTIDVGTSVSSGDFTLRSDGAGGTDVIVDTVFGTYTSGVTLLTNPTIIAATGTASNTATNGKAVSGLSSTNWALTNFGLVSETASGGIGISFASAGTITNASGGRITAASDGVLLTGGGLVTNASGGVIIGSGGFYAKSVAATLINAGSIRAAGAAAGAQLSAGGQVTNQSGGIITGYSGVLGEATTTVVNAGTIDANLTANGGLGVVLFGSGTVTNLSGGVITGDYGVAITALGTLVNAGTIAGNATNATAAAGFYASGGGLVTNQSGGVITGFKGVWAATTALTVRNAGSIGGNATVSGAAGILLAAGGSVTNQSGATISGFYGVMASGATATVVNAGTIAGYYTANNADGVYLQAGGSVTNQSGGTISGDNNGIRIAGATGTVVNLGVVRSNDIPGQNGGAGIYLADGGAVTNGASGGTASSAYILGYRYAVQFGAAAAGTLTNFGTISGNPGNPAVVMAAGTLINGPSGATGALIEGGDQTNAVLFTGVATVVNYARIIGVENGGDPNTYYGVKLGGASGSLSNLGTSSLIENYVGIYATNNDTVTNAGTIASNYSGGRDALIFGGGTNRLILDPGATFIGAVSGGGPVTLSPSGNTQVIGTANGIGVTTLELASASSAGTLRGLGTTIVNFASLVFDSGAQWTVTGNNSASGLGTLGISGFTFGDTIDLTGFVATSRTFASNTLTLTNAGGTHEALAMQGTFSTANVAIASDGSGGTDISLQLDLNYGQTIDQAGIIATTETVTAGVMTLKNGVSTVGSIAVGGTLNTSDFTLRSDGAGGTDVIVSTVFGTYTSGVTLLTDPTTIANTASISATAGKALYGAGGSPGWTINNYGVINGGTSAYGIQLGNGGNNAGSGSITNAAGGLIAGRYGIRLYNSSPFSIVNLAGGTIAATGTNSDRAIDLEIGAGTVTNAGLITAQTTGPFDVGVELDGGGSVTNTAGGTISGGWGVLVAGAGTVVNAGTIGGVFSNEFAGALSTGDRLVVDPGAVFIGAVNGGQSGGSSTLELASAASAGTLTATNFTNFSTIDFDAGAAWTLAGATTALSGAIVGFTFGDTIDLTGFVATSRTFGSNTLTLTNAGGTHAALAIQGTFATGNFRIASDGSGGTDITEQPLLLYAETIDAAGILATSETVTAGVMTLRNGGGTVVGTIAVGGSLATGDFSLQSDGSGGTDVVVHTATESYASGLTLLVNPTTIASTAQVYNTAAAAAAVFGPSGTSWSLTNFGSVAETGSAGIGISFAASGTIINAGTVSGDLTTAGGGGITLAAGGSVTNQSGGSISGRDGVWIATGAGVVVNAGSIGGSPTLTASGGVVLNAGGSVTNQSGGTIGGFYALWGRTAAISVANQGSIGGNSASTLGIGLYLSTGGTLTNASSGTITGFNALYTRGAATIANAGSIGGNASNAKAMGAYLKGTGSITNQSGGTISGFRGVVSTGSTVDNAGSIAGNAGTIGGVGVLLTGGGPVTNQSGGTISGYVGLYAKSVAASVVNAGGIFGNSTASAGKGISLVAGGTVSNQSGGTISGLTGIVLSGVAATVVNAGYIAANLTAGSGIALTAGGVVTNQAGGTISGSYGVNAASVAATVVNAGSIGDGTSLPTGAAIALKHGGLIVNQSGGDIIAGLQGIYIGGAAGTIVNAGSIGGGPATGNGVIFATGGAVTNQSSGSITGRYGVRAVSSAVTVVNTGGIGGNLTTGGGVNLAAGGSVTNQAGGTITGLKGVLATGATVTNAGSIGGNTTIGTGAGVRLTGGGSATNLSTGVITGFDGILAAGGATVVNAGSIGGTTAVSFGSGSANRLVVDPGAVFSGTVDGGNTIGAASISTLELASSASAGTLSGLGTQFIHFANITVDANAAWTLSNANTLAAGATLAAAGALTASGAFQNDGAIIGTGPGYGINIAASSTLTNFGGAVIKGVGGVAVSAGGTLINAGTIATTLNEAGSAVAFFGGGGRLIDMPGAVFYGFIHGDGAVLELASGSSAGTITALGGAVTNFTSLVFDSGAQWTVSGDDAASGLGTLGISGFTIGDTIDLTGFVAAGETFASNALTLSDGIGDFESLNIQGAFATDNFHLGTDGAGGTDITFLTPPTIVAGSTVTFTGGGAPVTLDGAVSITDPNSATLVSGTVSIGGGFLSGDTLSFVDQNGITGSFDSATGTLTLTGSATLADYQAALDSITYSFNPSFGDPTAGGDTVRVIDWVVDDGTNPSTVASSTLDTVHVAPTITTGGSVSFTGGGSAVALDSTLTLSDPDSGGLLNGGTVSIAGFVSGDILSADTTGLPSITTSYNAATGVLTLSGSDTLADYQAVLRSITYSVNPADGDPTGGGGNTSRTIDWLITDGASANGISNTGTSTLDTVHVGPTITTGGTVSYIADGTAAVLDPSVTITDLDSAGAVAGATVSIGAGFTSGDLLNFTNQNGISGSYDTVSGTLTLSGAATIANYEAALESVTYTFIPNGGDPTAGGTDVSRTIAWSVNDGVDTSSASGSSLDLGLPPPVIGGAAAGQTTTDEATINPFSGVSITDPNSGQSETITITVTQADTATDADGTLSGSGLTKTGTGTYTLTVGTPAAVTTALDALLFTPTAHQVVPGGTVTTGFTLAATDTLSQSATDGTTTVAATAVNDPPVIAGSVAGQSSTDETTLSPFSGVAISDVDVGQTETVTVTLSNAANGILSNLDGGSYDSGTGVYSVTGTDAAVTTALDGLVFTPTAHQVAPGGSVITTFTIAATDTAGGTTSNSTTTVGVTAVNDAPVIAGAVAGQTTTDEATLSPFSGVAISDVDFGQTETVTVTLSNATNGALSNLDGGSFDSGTGVYSVTGTDAAVTTAVDGLVFTPTAHQVAPGGSVTTTFTIAATDTAGGTNSDSTTTVDTTAVNDPPVITGTVAGQRTSDNATIQPFSDVTISDPDVGASETVTITLTDGGTPTDGDGMLSGTGLTETGTGTYTLAAGSPNAVTAALDALIFTPTQDDVTPYGTITTGMTLSVTDGIVGSPTTDTTTSVSSIACFAAGTRIATPRGAVAVERLREGDKVLTVSGKARPIQWMGRRTLDPNRHTTPERVKPVRIAAHAFGQDRPRRALLLSPDHSVFIEDVMIPIRHLINGSTVVQIEVPSVTYYHIELESHDVVLAEGLPAETYLETGGRSGFENGGGVIDLHPDFAPDENRVGMVWRNFAYAPLIGSDGQLDRVRVRLALQALMLRQQGGSAAVREKRVRRVGRS